MAFISQIHRHHGRNSLPPSVTFSLSGKGGCVGRVSKATPFCGKRIDIQIDELVKMIRIGERKDGVSCSKGGSFSCSRAVNAMVGSERIALTDGGDGWWYGSYATGARGEPVKIPKDWIE